VDIRQIKGQKMKIQKNNDKCNRCLLCVRDCVAGAWRNVNGEPIMADPELCSRCGHCVAVCPRSAIFHDSLDYRQITKTNADLLKPESYQEIVLGRRSIRQYKKTEVPPEVIENILKLASHSPTASNKQSVAYTVISDKAILKDLSESVFGFGKRLYEKSQKGLGKAIYFILKTLSPENVARYLDPMDYYIRESDNGRDYILHGAPVLILVHGLRKENFINENCNIATANIMNFAHSSGLGTCYIGFLTLAMKYAAALRNKARIPKSHRVYAALVLGYPSYGHPYTVSRKEPAIRWIRS
jgi:nitroreductase/NAD-dependent dihydropyrimidine dehydrogenase PreA subunit